MTSNASLACSPSGHLRWLGAEDASEPPASLGDGLLDLLATKPARDEPPTRAFGRRIASAFVLDRLQRGPRSATSGPSATESATWLLGAPPMLGGEYLSHATFEDAFARLTEELARRTERSGNAEEFLRSLGPAFALVGRVCLHLAENKRTPETPFAFLATFARGVDAKGEVVHAPLARALTDHASDEPSLRALLEPLLRAAERCAWLGRRIEDRSVFRPIPFGADEALAFLHDADALEAAGVAVRLPATLVRGRGARVRSVARLGSREPAGLGAERLIDFEIGYALDGVPLDEAEVRALLAGSAGLRLVRGRWVEVDPAALLAATDRLEAARRLARDEGLTFHEAMKLLAGLGSGPEGDEPGDEAKSWTGIEAGPWLTSVLARLEGSDGDVAVPNDLRASLRTYQRKGLGFLGLASDLGIGVCLADDMGLGKTIQVLAALLRERDLGRGPSLLVVPASLLGNWRAEAARFAPSLRMLPMHRSLTTAPIDPASLGQGDVVLTTYGTLVRTEALAERSWNLVVLDEAQAIKNAGTRVSRHARSLRARARIALSGTPIENRIDELHALFTFLDPGLLGTPKAFRAITKSLAADPVAGYAPLRRFLRPYILRRLKSDPAVAPDLPEKTLVRVEAGLTPAQAALYGTIVDELAAALEGLDGIQYRGAVLAAITKMKQVCNHPSQLVGDAEFDPRASGKFQRLADLAETIFERQERMLVFTQFREMVNPLVAHLARVAGRTGLSLDGSTPVAKRQAIVDAFQAEDGPPFLVLSVKAGGTGLNLTAASHVVHFDRWWNPAVEDQATDRAFRIGQKKNVMVHAMVCRGTVEESIDALIARKRALAEDVLSFDGAGALTELSPEELLRAVSLDLFRATQLDEVAS